MKENEVSLNFIYTYYKTIVAIKDKSNTYKEAIEIYCITIRS